MTLGRLISFAAILAASLGFAVLLVRRHRSREVALSAPAPAPARHSSSSVIANPRSLDAGASAKGSPEPSLEDPLSLALCPTGMLLIDGTTCGEREPRCLEREHRASGGCLEYAPSECRKGLPVRACVDRYEYPNVLGMLPATLITFDEAKSACRDEGKRLCTETEWLFACEGPRANAFSDGNVRHDRACNVGRLVPEVAPSALWYAPDIGPALARVDARTPSGAMPCESPFGVRDLLGNVEEWVKSDSSGFDAALRGGNYSTEPTCRATRLIHQRGFRQVHTGFRCCRDPLVRIGNRSSAEHVVPPN